MEISRSYSVAAPTFGHEQPPSPHVNPFWRAAGIRVLLVLLALIFGTGACSAQKSVNIHRIQSFLPDSPMYGSNVLTQGLVTLVLHDGFYIENSYETHWCLDPTILNCWDNDVTTAEGIFVHTGRIPDPSYAQPGYLVSVTGKVVHSNNSADPAARGLMIEVSDPPSRVDSAVYPMPPTIDAHVFASARTGVFGQWLEFAGMQVKISTLLTTSGTGGTVAGGTQAATSDGRFWGVMPDKTGANRPFRDPGISILDPVPAGAPGTVSQWSGNPSLLLIDSTARGGAPVDVTAGETVSDLVGIVDYHESAEGYTAILLRPDQGYGSIAPGPAPQGTPAALPSAVQSTVATQNLDNFVDRSTADATGFANRVDKAALDIVHFLNSPDILAVQQVQSMDALDALTAQIEADGGPTYTACWFKGNDPSALANGILVNPARVDVVSCSLADASKTYKAPDGKTATLFDRPPLILEAGLRRGQTVDFPLTVVNSELQDRTNIDDAAKGRGVRARRAAQAQELSAIVQQIQHSGKHVVVAGAFDSFEFSDGFVDTMGAIAGNPVDANLVTTPTRSVTNPALINLTTGTATPASDRYTYVENGSAEQTDHILVSSELGSMASLSYARIGADYPVADLNDNTTALHASSHDGLVGYLAIPQGAQFTVTSSVNPSIFMQNVVFTATLSGSTGVPTGAVTFYDGDSPLCVAQPLSGGSTTCAINTLSIGQHTIKADPAGLKRSASIP